MGKLKEFISKATDIVSATYKWIATDGLQHILICYAIMLTLSPIIGKEPAFWVTTLVAIGKETYDLWKKKNNLNQALHDLVCDYGGIGASYITMWVWAW